MKDVVFFFGAFSSPWCIYMFVYALQHKDANMPASAVLQFVEPCMACSDSSVYAIMIHDVEIRRIIYIAKFLQ
jgi:hypothetical protein